MIPLLYLDMDGTLLGTDDAIRAESLEAIGEYRACGGMVGLATGRTIEQVRPYLAQVRPDLPLVLFNGAVTYDASGTTILRREGLEGASLGPVLSVLSDERVLGVLAQYDDGRTLADRETAAVVAFAARSHVTIEGACDLADCVVHPAMNAGASPAKLLVLTTQDSVMSLQADLQARLSGSARAVVGNARDGVIEVLAPTANKGAAIEHVAQGLGFAKSSWAAIGDSQNDVEMVSMGTLGLAMGNCHPDTCAAADAVLTDNDSDAIAGAIRAHIAGPSCRKDP